MLKFVDFLEKQEKQKDIQVNVMFLLYYIIQDVINEYIEIQLKEESQKYLNIIQKLR